MEQSKLEALLGRSLTPREVTNKELYLDIAKDALEALLCTSLCKESGERTFHIREGYDTIFTDIFTKLNSATINGVTQTAIPYFWNNQNSNYFNSIVIDDLHTYYDEIIIDADWGFSTIPNDLQLLLAELFANTSKKYSVGSVKSKSVEDFSITYGDLTDDQDFVNRNARIISKYSLCNIGEIKSGRIRH